MEEKETADVSECDDQSAGALAAGSMAKFFKEQNWKIVSFFPNAPCLKNAKKLLTKKKDKKNPDKPSKN